MERAHPIERIIHSAHLVSHTSTRFSMYLLLPLGHNDLLTKDTRITRCVTPYDLLAHDFFAVALEVAPGSLEQLFFLQKNTQVCKFAVF